MADRPGAEPRGITLDQLSESSGMEKEDILMLGRPPYGLLKPNPRSGRYRLSQISWARFLLELRAEKRMTWLEVRDWAEKRQRRR